MGSHSQKWLDHLLTGSVTEKVLNHIADAHGGKLSDSRYGKRMSGEGNMVMSIRQMFKMAVKKHLSGRKRMEYDLTIFRRPGEVKQMELF